MLLSAFRSWSVWITVAAVILGCQAITASTTSRPRLMVMLPSDPMDAAVRDRFLRGFATGAHSVAACDSPMPAVRWQDIAPRQSPLQLISPSSGIQLLVAPPSADLRAFAGVSRQRDLPILLPYQRGTSLSTLRGLEERQRLWPLVPSRLDDVRATVAAAMQEGWGRAMVVASPGAVEAFVTDQFVDLYRLAGGHVETFEPTPVQRVDPLDQSRFNRFRDDMNWSWVSTVVVADHPDGPLASRLREAQQRGVFGGGAPETPNWVWLSAAEVLTSVPDVPWQQLGLQHPARGENWMEFQGAYQEQWGGPPDLLSAAGYDTARLLALVAAAPLPKTGDGAPDPMGWIDPDAPSVSVCEALQQRRAGQPLRLSSAASDARLRAGMTPSGNAQAGLLRNGSSGRMVAGLNRIHAATE